MDAAHFLLTRFNVPSVNVLANPGLDDGWLEKRFALFEGICLPSVLAQENKDFHWILVIDPQTPERWRSRLQADLKPLAATHLLPLNSLTEANVAPLIEQLTSGSAAPRVITTRLDNDDAISRDYLKTIAERAASLTDQDRCYVLNYRYGCQVSREGCFAVAEKVNPFLSVVSPRQPLLTAWHTDHPSMKRFGKVIDRGFFTRRSPYWLQAIHGSNVENRLQRKRTVLDPRELARFSLAETWMSLL